MLRPSPRRSRGEFFVEAPSPRRSGGDHRGASSHQPGRVAGGATPKRWATAPSSSHVPSGSAMPSRPARFPRPELRFAGDQHFFGAGRGWCRLDRADRPRHGFAVGIRIAKGARIDDQQEDAPRCDHGRLPGAAGALYRWTRDCPRPIAASPPSSAVASERPEPLCAAIGLSIPRRAAVEILDINAGIALAVNDDIGW